MPGGEDWQVVEVDGGGAGLLDLLREPVALEVGAALQTEDWRIDSGSSLERVRDQLLAP